FDLAIDPPPDPTLPQSPAQVLLDCWRQGAAPLEAVLALAGDLPAPDLVEVLSAEQYDCWQNGQTPPAEEYLPRYPAVAADPDAACELVYCEFRLRLDLGESPPLQDYQQRFPELAAKLQKKHAYEQRQSLLRGLSAGSAVSTAPERPPPRP